MTIYMVAFLLLMILATRTTAGEYFVATNGEASNDGTRETPWPSVEHALSITGGGHTITLLPGTYRGPIVINKQFAGTEDKPTIIRSDEKWKATVIGAEYHGISNGDDCHWTIIDGFEVLGARYDGIKMNGDHNSVRNCWLHNNGHMGIGTHNKVGTVIENNLIEFNGSHIQFHHGVYASGDSLKIRSNIVRHNSGYGLHLYSSIKNSVISNNLVYGQVLRAGIILACPDGGGKNTIVNNTIADNRVGISIWKGNGETVVNNIIAATDEIITLTHGTEQVTINYNLCHPASDLQGPGGISNDPGFVDSSHGVYWLAPDSPAKAGGSPELAPGIDFWSCPTSSEKTHHFGAFPFEAQLCTEEARASWYYNWAYQNAPASGGTLVDFWETP